MDAPGRLRQSVRDLARGAGAGLAAVDPGRLAGRWLDRRFRRIARLFLPSSLIAFAVSRIWNRYRGRPWQGALEEGLAPLATGLILSGAFTVLLSSSGTVSLWLIVAVCTAIFILRPKLNPLPVLLAAGMAQVAVSAFS
jgi:chromate transport protein ChrA